MQYHRGGTHPIEGIQPLVYVDPDPMHEEVIEEELAKDDVGFIKDFTTWW